MISNTRQKIFINFLDFELLKPTPSVGETIINVHTSADPWALLSFPPAFSCLLSLPKALPAPELCPVSQSSLTPPVPATGAQDIYVLS